MKKSHGKNIHDQTKEDFPAFQKAAACDNRSSLYSADSRPPTHHKESCCSNLSSKSTRPDKCQDIGHVQQL